LKRIAPWTCGKSDISSRSAKRQFTRAAVICGISQPSLSTAIRRLEQELGGALFDRGPPVRLSPLGQVVKPHFKTIASTIDEIRRIAADYPPPKPVGNRLDILAG
jgi:LysR family hydrogen peroxide-inducible transcriptional activator